MRDGQSFATIIYHLYTGLNPTYYSNATVQLRCTLPIFQQSIFVSKMFNLFINDFIRFKCSNSRMIFIVFFTKIFFRFRFCIFSWEFCIQ